MTLDRVVMIVCMVLVLHRSPHGCRLTQPVELSSSKMPPKMMPSLMPDSWKPLLVMSPVPPIPFLSTPKWNWPCPLTSLAMAWVWETRAALSWE